MLRNFGFRRYAITRIFATAVLIIVVIAAIAGGTLILSQQHPSSSSSSTATSVSSTSATISSQSASTSSSTLNNSPSSSSTALSTVASQTVSSNSSSSTSTSSNSTFLDTLKIDDIYWPFEDFNQLYSLIQAPWPNWLEETMYQSLVGVNVKSEYQTGIIQYTPDLATNWTVSSDGKTYTFDIRQNVTFSNGDPLNSYQVWMEMYGFYYLSGNSSSWLQSYSIFDMSNVTFGPATISLINQSGGLINPGKQALAIMQNSSWPVYAPNANQLVFRLRAPFNYFPGTLVAFEGLIFDSQFILNNGGFGTPASINSYFNQHPIPGTGPYQVTQISENAFVELSQSPTYWGRSLSAAAISSQPLFDPGHVKNVIVFYKSDDLARYTDLATGAAQISSVTSSDWNLVLANAGKYSYFKMPAWGALMTALSLNTQVYPTNITAVRQAIVHAINYTDLANKAFFGQVSPMVGPEYPAWKDFYNLGNFTPYSYNITLAKQYLVQAGITNFPTINYNTLSGCPFCLTISEVIQSDLSQIGINVNINVMSVSAQQAPYGSYSTEVQNANQISPLALLGTGVWAPATLTPADYWVSFVSNQSLIGNYAIYSNPVVQQAVNAFTSSSNTTYIQSLVKQAQAQIYNDAPYAWFGVNNLWDASGSLVWDKSVISGFYVDPVWSGQNTGPLFNTVTFA